MSLECPLCGEELDGDATGYLLTEAQRHVQEKHGSHLFALMTSYGNARWKFNCACGSVQSLTTIGLHFASLNDEEIQRHRLVHEMTSGV